ncbi:response regulator, partial [Salmonella enterica subsp. enterica serovar Oranienburg]|nr:response regulator [Salmonella enterica subsp. enterica serovar Oranienburg]
SEVYRVDHVADGESALQRALSRRYEAMVVDRRLPGIDGIALVQAVRPAHIATPILLLTALGSVHDRVEGLDVGATD